MPASSGGMELFMDIKGMQKRIGHAGSSACRIFTVLKDKPFLIKTVLYPLKFIIGFLLSKGIILGGYSPFGLGYAAALGATSGASFGIIGVILGYLSIIHKANGLKYIASCILIYTAGFVFRETSLMKTRWFMPIAALVSSASVGFVFVADSGFRFIDTVFYLTEVTLATACAYFYQSIFNPDVRISQNIKNQPIQYSFGTLILAASLLIPLSGINIIGDVSLGHIAAVFCIMLAAYFGGMGLGSIVGVALGLAIGIADASSAFCAIYGFSGIAAGAFCKKGKTLFAAVYIVANVSVMLWINGGTDIAMLYETFFASVLFLLIGEFFSDRLSVLFASASVSNDSKEKKIRYFAHERLKSASKAFNDLSDMLNGVFNRMANSNDNDVTCIFDRAAQQICRKCVLANACWEKDYLSTKDALNGALRVMLDRGSVEASDFPLHFSSRCVSITEFISAINSELNSYLYRRQYKSRINESRSMICNQYKEISHIFDGMASHIENEPVFEERLEDCILSFLKNKHVDADICVYRDRASHLHLQIDGDNLTPVFDDLEQYMTEFSDILGINLTEPQCRTGNSGHRLLSREREVLSASLGVAVHKKKDSDISGDSGSYFKLDNGVLCVILSDGMGTGKSAATESAAAISMLERFLKSGIDPKTALTTIHSALILKSEQTGSFATLDLMCANLFNGETSFYKFGGAPTYIKRGRQIRRITSSALPAGISCGAASEIDDTRIRLFENDLIVMASDGIADINDDAWLQELLSETNENNPKTLAAEILSHAFTKYGRSDDMTIMVVALKKNSAL